MSRSLKKELSRLAARERGLESGEVLFRREDPVRHLYLVEEGEIALLRHTIGGSPLTLQRAGAGTILAEASIHSGGYHCDAVATKPSRVRAIPKTELKRALAGDPWLAEAWMEYLAREVQRARTAVEIINLKTVGERLAAWLDVNGGAMPPKGHWRWLAAEIGVTPEALYRELAKRRRAHGFPVD